MQYCYALLALETKPASNTTEDVMLSKQTTMSAADAEVIGGVAKMFSVTLSPVVVGGLKVDGYWSGSTTIDGREIKVWLTRIKQMIRIG